MTTDNNSEITQFLVEDVLAILKDAVDVTIQNQQYQHSKVPQWTSSVIDHSMKKLQELNRPFKYIVTCTIFQKVGAGFHTASSCLWDTNTDGNCSYRWENKTMYCITSVFGCRA
ncbi:cytoplasmic dynein light chain [Heterostelium album PN500]|uniref:Cytoplasmic dynein light chain n=1 Tax=Heterostelium pallidum (strain ATCC 26659 / Pp 5 / PN500) TaxID=670386 RepID=D3BKH9_HETP5|nr:cytoplasmic dynein light chain [Heterostelium album PN500]EFA78409.1 cytoplasmic dynein light chain [Heterostelium album PN500]|eukprot:XP_020430534.1 cytoplasmic dynein light chain [Heterostelium album PN500]